MCEPWGSFLVDQQGKVYAKDGVLIPGPKLKEMQERIKELRGRLSPEQVQKLTKYIKEILEGKVLGSSFRHLIYTRLGYESYPEAYYQGLMDLNNTLLDVSTEMRSLRERVKQLEIAIASYFDARDFFDDVKAYKAEQKLVRVLEGEDYISQCAVCLCMTKTVEGKCGKCKESKDDA